MSELKNEDVLKVIGNYSVMELISLTKELENKWGLKAAPPVVLMKTQETQVQTVVQTEFDVFLASVPADKKMNVIKMVRETMGLGLKEAKDFVESAPKMLKEAVSAEEADVLKEKLTAAGAVIEVK
ncbi:RplL Ribosomal protein L7/L12 [uncultured Caudovirales phage]|uniref:RplL Ribosomal protein L7/L12 n=1 Tax=uncultured Caudovirales phage TaxID=2100421 RepID=A0A6J5RY10_9CAUD|nr:RplL Ribosomal protein L7/L12 [uncultured Caudovirales phage]